MILPMWMNGQQMKPCRTFCHEVERLCPYFLPAEKTGPGSQYAGEPSFLCLGNIDFQAHILTLYTIITLQLLSLHNLCLLEDISPTLMLSITEFPLHSFVCTMCVGVCIARRSRCARNKPTIAKLGLCWSLLPSVHVELQPWARRRSFWMCCRSGRYRSTKRLLPPDSNQCNNSRSTEWPMPTKQRFRRHFQ